MLQFVREIPVRILIEKASSERRGFLFYLAAGFAKEIDPLSGMTVNLVKVDQWLTQLKANLEKDVFNSFAEIMAIARLNLVEQAEKEGATLKSLRFREERNWSFSWDARQSPEQMLVSHLHFTEAFTQDPEIFDLLKIEFSWQRLANCEADFQHEGFKILKSLSAKTFPELRRQLSEYKGKTLESGSLLQAITLHHLAANYSVQL